MNGPGPSFPVDLPSLLGVVRARARLVASCAAAALLAATVGLAWSPSAYRATALLRLVPPGVGEPLVDPNEAPTPPGFQEVERFYRTEMQVMGTATVAREVIARYRALGHSSPDSADSLLGRLDVFPRQRSQVVEVSVTDVDPARAAALSTLFAEVYLAHAHERQTRALQLAREAVDRAIVENDARLASLEADLLATHGPERHALEVDLVRTRSLLARLVERREDLELRSTSLSDDARLIEPAEPPGRPTGPDLRLQLGLALLTGTALGVLLAVLSDAVDDSLGTPDDVGRQLDLPCLGTLPAHPGDTPWTDLHERAGPVAEAARGLRAVVDARGGAGRARTHAVTSSAVSEGRARIAVWLAVALARSGKRVVLVDADRHGICLRAVFDLPPGDGLDGVLVDGRGLDRAVQATSIPGLFALCRGSLDERSDDLLGSARMRVVVEELGRAFAAVLVIAPPAGACSAGLDVARVVDDVLLIADGGVVPGRAVRHTVDRLRQVGAQVMGIVLHGVAPAGGGRRPVALRDDHPDVATVEPDREAAVG